MSALSSTIAAPNSATPTEPSMVHFGSPPSDPPIAVIMASAIVGGLALLILILSSLLILCFISQRKEKRSPIKMENGEAIQNKTNGRQTPIYAQVFRSSTQRNSLKKPKSTKEESVKITVAETPKKAPPPKERGDHYPKPEEISAFRSDVPKTFRPFAPPPLNTCREGIEEDYDEPISEHYDFLNSINERENDLTQSLQIYSSPGANPRAISNRYHPQRSSYKEPRSFSARESNLTTSLNVHSSLEKVRSFSSQNDYQHPRSITLPRGNNYQFDNHIYSESLTPSMLGRRGSVKTKVEALPYPPIYDRPKPVLQSDQPTEVTRKNVVEIQDLGMGRFGRVVLAATTGLSLKDLQLGRNDNVNRSLLVAIKKLREDADSQLCDAFQNEIKFMSKLKHANVVRLLGVCSSGVKFLMMEYMEKGDLHEFLQKQVLVSDSVNSLGEEEVTPLVLLYMGVQIASGMRYLAKKKFVHRDLATRNCLVGRDFIVKISDFGMSRNLYDTCYYLIQGRLILPIRWMAYESFYGKFSTRSDAWSYAITLWEIYTMAKFDPYHELTDDEYISDTMKGARRKILQKPDICPKEVYDVLLRCWVHEPNMRADFEEIYSRLFLVYTRLSKQTL